MKTPLKTPRAIRPPVKIRPGTPLERLAKPHHAFVAFTDPKHPSLDGYGPTEEAALANWHKVNPSMEVMP